MTAIPTARRRRLSRSVVAFAAAAAALGSGCGGGSTRDATAPRPQPDQVAFAGRTWQVKSSATPVGPGPNRFDGSERSVWVDGDGRLHLRITRVGSSWHSAEVIGTTPIGPGTYTWTLDSPVDALDPSVVLGLFTYSDDPASNHREIDIEFSRFHDRGNPINGQFAVQPHERPGNVAQFRQDPIRGSVMSFTWTGTTIAFVANPSVAPDRWTYTGPDVPKPGPVQPRINLWLLGGRAPVDGREVEVVLRDFTFTPAEE